MPTASELTDCRNNALALMFEGKRVQFLGTWENPEWVAQDVCNVLEIEHVGSSLRSLKDKYKGVRKVHTLGGTQTLSVVYEAGLYVTQKLSE